MDIGQSPACTNPTGRVGIFILAVFDPGAVPGMFGTAVHRAERKPRTTSLSISTTL
ncbi:uncharacterized protein FTOL_13045 [Fusarium torulosum]|uniref:Uncharacterized protein n=1 Tax=Fusarium torulosum TaxID=33205 RepID=A0AAE8MLW5_9HYPO|nr:uncharacterized protein FTOL_13045 [Fusarium torulosum]